MKQGAALILVLSALAVRVNAADLADGPCSGGASAGYSANALLGTPRPLLMPMRGNSCADCGEREHHSFNDRVQRLWDFIIFRPTIPCNTGLQPSGYIPPLRSWFPCKEQTRGGCASCCGQQTCGRGGSPGGSTCNSCGAAALGAPVAVSQPTRSATQTALYTTLPRPAYTAAPPAPPQRKKGWEPMIGNPIPQNGAPVSYGSYLQPSNYSPYR